MGELGLCRIVLDLGVAGDGVTTDSPDDGGDEVDMRSQVRERNIRLYPHFVHWQLFSGHGKTLLFTPTVHVRNR